MLSVGELVALAGVAIFFLGRKEGLQMLQQSRRTMGKFWKELSKDGDAAKGAAAPKPTPGAKTPGDTPSAGRSEKD